MGRMIIIYRQIQIKWDDNITQATYSSIFKEQPNFYDEHMSNLNYENYENNNVIPDRPQKSLKQIQP